MRKEGGRDCSEVGTVSEGKSVEAVAKLEEATALYQAGVTPEEFVDKL